MILSFWRRAHLLLALFASLFLIITSITGVILSFSPISNELSKYHIHQAPETSVAELIGLLQKEYEEVIEVKITPEEFLEVSVIMHDGNFCNFYAHPKTGKKIGEVNQEAPLFSFSRSLHRSLFLGDLGRYIIGFTAFLLLLISVSGIALVIKRQLGIKRFFTTVIRENFYHYWHIVLGRWSLVLILLISLTGTYLSMNRFGLFPKKTVPTHSFETSKMSETPKRSVASFEQFRETHLSEITSLQFPFSSDPEDYFVLKLPNEELIINQFTGEIISTQSLGNAHWFEQLSFNLHTGKGSILWSIILALASLSILFFIFSGAKITLNRLKGKTKNVYSKDDSHHIILVGSEGGSTLRLAKQFQHVLIESGHRVYLDELNNYHTYLKMNQLIIFTSTYGNGEAPSNAQKFTSKLSIHQQNKPFTFSVVGFGSTDYPQYCRFSEAVQEALEKYDLCSELLPLTKINKASFQDVAIWVEQWSAASRIRLKATFAPPVRPAYSEFEVLECTPALESSNFTFLLTLKTKGKSFQSGDLFAVQFSKNEEERFYSIGVTREGQLLLCIRKHSHGRCSTYLSNLKSGDTLNGRIHSNPTFHLPKSSSKVIAIANGTGISPFIGMANEIDGTGEFHLYWGGKSRDVLAVFEPHLAQLKSDRKILSFSPVFSNGIDQEARYVQALLKENAAEIADSLAKNAVILICGSLTMRTDVLNTLDTIVRVQNSTSLVHYEKNGQIKIDCY